MSYYVKVNFVSNVDTDKIYEVMREAINEQKTRIDNIVKDNISYAMLLSGFPLCLDEYKSIPHRKRLKLINNLENQLKPHFKLIFIYWKEKQLLGIIGDTKLGSPIEFQNSCDTDYDYEEWKVIPCLSDKVKKYTTSSDIYIMERYQQEYGFQLDLSDTIDYYRRSFLYDAIVKDLDIEAFLYNEDNFLSNHLLLNVNTIETDRDKYIFTQIVQKYLEIEYEKG